MDDSKFYRGYFVASVDEIRDVLRHNLKKNNQESVLCSLVFAHESHEITKRQLVEKVGYWNFRSKKDIHFFFPGYLGDTSIGDSEFGPNLSKLVFSDETFVECIEIIERHSNWKYIGTPTMLLFQGTLYEDVAYLDTETMIDINFQKSLDAKLIPSIEELFEILIRVGQKNHTGTIDAHLLRHLFGKSIYNSVIDTIFANLPIKMEPFTSTIDAIRLVS